MTKTQTKTPTSENTALGYDSLLEDLFGLNIRGLKTIWALFRRPHEYFIAAKDRNWQDRFTPSFRVWFAIMAIGTACTFIWAGNNSPMLGIYTDMMSEVARGANLSLEASEKVLDMSSWDPAASAKYLVKSIQLILPFAYFFFFILLAAIYRAWGEKLSFVIRLRYVFAIIVPGSLIGYIFAMVTINVPQEVYQRVNGVGVTLMFISYICVAYFGPYRNLDKGGRLGRSLAITVLIIIAVMLSSLVATILGLLPAIKSTFPDVIDIAKDITPKS